MPDPDEPQGSEEAESRAGKQILPPEDPDRPQHPVPSAPPDIVVKKELKIAPVDPNDPTLEKIKVPVKPSKNGEPVDTVEIIARKPTDQPPHHHHHHHHRQKAAPETEELEDLKDSDTLLAVVLSKEGRFTGRKLSNKAMVNIMRSTLDIEASKIMNPEKEVVVSADNTYVIPQGVYFFPKPLRVAGFTPVKG